MASGADLSHSADIGHADRGADRIIERSPGRSVLDGAFRVLRALPDTPPEGQITRLSEKTGLPRPTVHRLLTQLRDVGAVEQVDGSYQLSPSVAQLGRRAEPFEDLRLRATRTMWSLRAKTGATIALIAPTDSGGIALDVMYGLAPLPVRIHPGLEMPPESAGVEILNGPRRSAIDDGRLLRDLTCCAVAIDLHGGIRASLAIMTPARDPASRYTQLTQVAAARISREARMSRRAKTAVVASPDRLPS